MLTANKKFLLNAYQKGYGIAQININNLEWAKIVLTTANELKSPIILGVSEKAADYMGGFKTVFNMVKSLDEFYKISVPVLLHLDHGSFEGVKQALEADFNSIMFSASGYSFEQNLTKTKEIINLCRQKNVLLEAEIGGIGKEEDDFNFQGDFSDPKQCHLMSLLDIDMLAVSIGNMHGEYSSNWNGLNFKVLEKINKITNKKPLVLHGGTGIPDEMIKKSISLGIAKINVNTACQLAFAKATREHIFYNKDFNDRGFELSKLFKPGFLAIKNIIKKKIRLFGSVNKI
ncbi:Fructose-bisphosphate aldolase [Candidatus Phytoplasma mali]|uniref:Fructose-bisphosphate aldolase n=1 Tax=Phytoplasma mali (strain AT) TaxID=482235 RepID=B3R0D2_PHYMT|nr:ketose-bisphosphate aldolase [Candidatus Phytoplasma mali]CAP18296.1 Fructose-bisphosphate aldolase [Candidatus Phytoplasma mali]